MSEDTATAPVESQAHQGQRLSDAAFSGNLDLLASLLASGIPIDSPDNDGFTALHRSCVTGNVDVIKFLLENNASPNIEDSYGDSPLHYACFCGHLEATKLLITVGKADIHRSSKDGKTPVESAAEEQHWHVVNAIKELCGDAGIPPIPPEVAAALAAGTYVPQRPTASPGGPIAPPPAKAPTSGKDKPRIIAGLDFGRDIIMEGPLHKKRANKVFKWRSKYYVLSSLYGALFFWTGTRDKVEGVIKKVRFETFYSVRHFKDKQGGKRFDLRVITGRTMCLLASSDEEALKWVTTLKSVVGKLMSAVRIQATWRGYRARKQLKKIQNAREAAVNRIAGDKKEARRTVGTDVTGAPRPKAKAGGVKTDEDGAVAGPSGPLPTEGIVLEGELRKRNHQVMTSLISAYRSRYFVLHKSLAALVYYENKAKRDAGVLPRSLPFLSLFSVVHQLDKKGVRTKTFAVKVISGKTFVFEAATVEAATKWVEAIESILPRDHLAATTIQRLIRGFLARRAIAKIRAEGGNVKALTSSSNQLLNSLSLAKSRAATESVRTQRKRARWITRTDPNGHTYYANVDSGETSWTTPEGLKDGTARMVGTIFSMTEPGTGRKYYVNAATGESLWVRPVDYVSEDDGPADDERPKRSSVAASSPSKAPRDDDSEDDGGDMVAVDSDDDDVDALLSGASTSERAESTQPGNLVPSKASAAAAAAVAATRSASTHTVRSTASVLYSRLNLHNLFGLPGADGWIEFLDSRSNRAVFLNSVDGDSYWVSPVRDEAQPVDEGADANEAITFALWINDILADCPIVGPNGIAPLIPLSLEAETPAIVTEGRSGALLAALVAKVLPGSFDARTLNLSAEYLAAPGSRAQIPGTEDPSYSFDPCGENVSLALNALEAAGIPVPSEALPESVVAGYAPAITDALWAIFKAQLSRDLSQKLLLAVPTCLLAAGESVDTLLSLEVEKLALRAINYHLACMGCDLAGSLDSFGQAFADGVALVALLRALAPELCADLPQTDDEVRALGPSDAVTAALSAAFGAGVQPWFTVEGIVEANPRLQFALVAQLLSSRAQLAEFVEFSDAFVLPSSLGAGAYSSFSAPSKPAGFVAGPHALELVSYEKAHSLRDSAATAITTATAVTGQSAVERQSFALAAFINSLDIEGVTVAPQPLARAPAALARFLADSQVLLQVLDLVHPGSVDWNQATLNPSLASSGGARNAVLASNVAKALGLRSAASFNAEAVSEGKDPLHSGVFALLEELQLQLAFKTAAFALARKGTSDSVQLSPAGVLAWANARAAAQSEAFGQSLDAFQLTSLGDSRVRSGHWLLHVVNSIRVFVVNWPAVEAGNSREAAIKNALYTVSVARKIGAQPAVHYADLALGNPRAVLLFLLSLIEAEALAE